MSPSHGPELSQLIFFFFPEQNASDKNKESESVVEFRNLSENIDLLHFFLYIRVTCSRSTNSTIWTLLEGNLP